MRRFLSLAVVLFFCLPFSVAVVGCHHAAAVTYCPGFSDSGPVGGQVSTIVFGGGLTTSGESLNYGQIGSALSATATDCFGASVAAAAFTFGTTNMQFADINPSTGQVCAGTWNRNTGGGVADYSICTPPSASVSNGANNTTPLVAYVTASADGATSNPIAIYIHPSVSSVVLGAATSSCSTDPSSNCCAANSSLVTTTDGVYTGLSCVSQNHTAQLVSKVYTGGFTDPAHNITCQVGHITYSPQSSSNVVSIDANGIATSNLPGSTTILANVSNSGSGSSAGFFSSCPPESIALSYNGGTNVNVALNNSQTLSTTVLDTKGNTISGLSLEYVSTSPQTLTAGSNTVTPTFPGTATVTAICQPGTCNPSPFSQIGYLGNGKPVSSNGVTVNTTGNSSNQVIVASTNSLYFYSVDFTTNSPGAIFKLPFQPNSMVLTQDGSTLYFGSTNVLMSASTLTGNVSAIGTIPGTVLAVSPDGSTLVIADSTRGMTSLYSSAGSLLSTYSGVGTRAQWTPDSSTVYIAAGTTMLVHNSFSGWTSAPVSPAYQDVAVTVPAYGAYFAAGSEVDGRTYCATSTGTSPSSPPPAVSNTFFPQTETENVPVQRLSATSDGAHILGLGFGTGGTVPNLYDLVITPPTSPTDQRLVCTTANGPVTLSSSPTTKPLNIPATSIFNSVVPALNSSLAFITYSVSAGGTGALPYYQPASGTLSSLKLSGTATAPLAGAFSSDEKTFYVTTSGDNALHLLTVNGTAVTDSSTIVPNLQNASGTGTAAPNLIAAHVKRATS